MQWQTAVTGYLSGEQLLLFAFPAQTHMFYGDRRGHLLKHDIPEHIDPLHPAPTTTACTKPVIKSPLSERNLVLLFCICFDCLIKYVYTKRHFPNDAPWPEQRPLTPGRRYDNKIMHDIAHCFYFPEFWRQTSFSWSRQAPLRQCRICSNCKYYS